MKLKKRRMRPSTCFAIGMAGALAGILAGALRMAGIGEAQYAVTASFVMFGAMLLFLGVMEKGDAQRGRRLKLLALFFALLLGNLGLPLLDWLIVAALPGAALMYRQKGDAPFIAVLLLFELADAVVRSLAIMPGWLGAQPLLVRGLSLALVSLVRGVVVLRLYLRARANPPAPEEPVHNLR